MPSRNLRAVGSGSLPKAFLQVTREIRQPRESFSLPDASEGYDSMITHIPPTTISGQYLAQAFTECTHPEDDDHEASTEFGVIGVGRML
ncbi:hypothetical protein OsI_22868 [Oryza sativa Indica Group]|jgi:hypothetical protein|uniref:Uncharacterized protein n=1 Tax=Oryza sativa subsp. indica TaxID=39946 RepID=A2YCM7_ORYSI|nr:hypothetical protein OsI_22868 [Oryza sativa Indica Group]